MSRWTGNNTPAFTPSMLNAADRCLHQYKAKYVDKVRFDGEFSIPLAQGNAVHAALARCYGQYLANRTFPINLREVVEACLHAEFGAQPWQNAVEATLEQVKWSLMAFDGTARVIATERWFEYAYPGDATYPAFRLRSRVDLVLGYDDGAIEHLDFKTGSKPIVDTIQNVASRIV